MADYPQFTITDLALFTGRPQASYGAYSDQALLQAALLWRISSGMGPGEYPEPGDDADLVRLAILQMADWLVLGQSYQQVAASPFSSETIGSYSYTKALNLMKAGEPTGVFWFDLAMQRLGLSTAHVTSDSYTLFDRDLTYDTVGGTRNLLGPADINHIDVPFSVSRPVAYDPNRS